MYRVQLRPAAERCLRKIRDQALVARLVATLGLKVFPELNDQDREIGRRLR